MSFCCYDPHYKPYSSPSRPMLRVIVFIFTLAVVQNGEKLNNS